MYMSGLARKILAIRTIGTRCVFIKDRSSVLYKCIFSAFYTRIYIR